MGRRDQHCKDQGELNQAGLGKLQPIATLLTC